MPAASIRGPERGHRLDFSAQVTAQGSIHPSEPAGKLPAQQSPVETGLRQLIISLQLSQPQGMSSDQGWNYNPE